MAEDLSPEDVFRRVKDGKHSPVYLFYGPGEFRLERMLAWLKETLVPASLRDLNVHFFYAGREDPGDRARPADILETAESVPFLSSNRFVVVRGIDGFDSDSLEGFLPYLDNPVPSTCLVFLSTKPDFRKTFYRRLREQGRAVNFRQLTDVQVVPWIRKTARELGMNLDEQACAYLHEIIGNRLRDLHAELEKLLLRHGSDRVGVAEVQELAIRSRSYTVFQLMDEISSRKGAESIVVLKRVLDEEGRDGVLRMLGMLNRQFGLLWRTHALLREGTPRDQLARKTGLQEFQVRRLAQQSKHWTEEDLERAYRLMYRADGLIKSSSPPDLVLETLVLGLCA